MEDLKHYSSLRDKYSQELNKSLATIPSQSRPQTAPKQVNFDFTNNMDLRELRNLREKHSLELERLATPSIEEIQKPKKSKKKKKKSKRREEEAEWSNFEVFEKPAIDLEHYSESDFYKHPKTHDKRQRNEENSPRAPSLCSEPSIISKRSLKEDIEEAFMEAKQALEDSFRQPSIAGSKNSHRSEQKIFEKEPAKIGMSGSSKRESSENSQILNSSKKFDSKNVSLNQSPTSKNSMSGYPNKNAEGKDIGLNKSNTISSNHDISAQSIKHVATQHTDLNKSQPISNKNDISIHSSEKSSIPKSLPKHQENKKYSSHQNLSIHTEIEEKIYPDSPKSSVDFSISDQTPFESIKFSQDSSLKVGFSQYFDKLKRGIYHRLLTPILQNQPLENSSDKQSVNEEIPPEFSASNKFLEEVFQEKSPKGSLKLGDFTRRLDFSPRTSRSEPIGHYIHDDSMYSHVSIMSVTNQCNYELPGFEGTNLSMINPPDLPQDEIQIKLEKAMLVFKALDDISIALMANNVCSSFLQIKERSSRQKEKIQKRKLADANCEYHLLNKSIKSWKICMSEKKLLNSKKWRDYLERWKFIKLYQTFQGLKFVCRAHKQWIQEVRHRLENNRRLSIFKNWSLYVRFRNVKQYLRFKRAKNMIKSWRHIIDVKNQQNRTACIHWYYHTMGKFFDYLKIFREKQRLKILKVCKANNFYNDKMCVKVFLTWKHSKELQKASFIPLRICTKTILVRKNGNIQEKILLDIKLIKN